jgi:hypothetical protein
MSSSLAGIRLTVKGRFSRCCSGNAKFHQFQQGWDWGQGKLAFLKSNQPPEAWTLESDT